MTTADDEGGPLVRPFAVTRGRTNPTHFLELVTLVFSVPSATAALGPEHRSIIELCRTPRSIAEVAALTNLPIGAAKVLICDLIDNGSVVCRTADHGTRAVDRDLIRTVIDGIRNL
jgi:hypothetical protein